MKLVEVGKISSSHGLKGSFKIERYLDNIEDFRNFEYIYIFGFSEPYFIDSVSIKKQSVFMKLKTIDDINTVENLIGNSIYVEDKQLSDLDKEQYFISDLIGLDVLYRNEVIGKVKNVINGISQDIIVIENFDKEAMIPFVKELVSDISLENQTISINLIEGLIPWL